MSQQSDDDDNDDNDDLPNDVSGTAVQQSVTASDVSTRCQATMAS